jgi:hypothetical protein
VDGFGQKVLPMSLEIFLIFENLLQRLRWTRMWQEKSSNRFYQLSGFVIHLVNVDFSAVSLSLKLYQIFKIATLTELSLSLAGLFTVYSIFFKSFWLLCHVEKINEMIEKLKDLLVMSSINENEYLNVKFKARILWTSKVLNVYRTIALLSGIIPFIFAFINYESLYYIAV